jgi:predicted amidohydrolase
MLPNRKLNMIRAAAIQFQHQPSDKAANLATICRFCQEAADKGCQIVCFPEMCITGYWHVRNLGREEIDSLAEAVPNGPTTQAIAELAKEFNLIVGAGLIEKSDTGHYYNTYVVAQPNGQIDKHRKLHCFISEHMSSGDSYTVIETDLGIKLGVLICYDNNLIENVRLTALKGADILLAPHQTGGCDSRSPGAMSPIDPALWRNRKADPEAIETEFKSVKGREWLMRWLPSRAHDNGLFIVFSNGVGEDDGEVRTGNSMIIDCYGRIIEETWQADEAMVVADMDLELLGRCTGRRWIRGRRPELYSELSRPQGNELNPREARFNDE